MKSIRRTVNHCFPTTSEGNEPDSSGYELQWSALSDSHGTDAKAERRALPRVPPPRLYALIRRCNTYGYVDVRAMGTGHARD